MSDEEFVAFMTDDLRDLALDTESDSDIPVIKAGSLDQLVSRLTFYKYPDPDFTEAFLLTYHSFTTPLELISKIIALYAREPPQNLSKSQFDKFYKTKVIPTRLRVVNVFKAWIDKHFEDFDNDEKLEAALLDFLDNNRVHHYYQQSSKPFLLVLSTPGLWSEHFLCIISVPIGDQPAQEAV